MNFYPPNVDDYHLVVDADKTTKCVKNENSCKLMKNDATCIECYVD